MLTRRNKGDDSRRKQTLLTHDPSKRKLCHANTFSFGDLLYSIFYLKLYHDQAFFHIKMVNLPVDNFSRTGIRTVAFDISEEEKNHF